MPLELKRPKGKNWYVSGTVGGKRFRRGTKTPRRDLAEALRIQWEGELEARRVYGPRPTATFAEAVNLYLDRGGEARFLAPLLAHFGKSLLADLDQAALDAAARALMPARPGQKAPAASTLNRQIYTPFIAVMTAAAEDGLAGPRKWRRPRGHDRRTRFRWLWPDEFEAVWMAAPAHGRILLDGFAGTGLREAEGLGLDWSDTALDLKQCWAWDTKEDDPRRVDLPDRTAASLANALHREGPVFLDGGGAPFVLQPDGGGALATSLRCWARDAGVAPFGAHVLRHTFATWFYSQTRDPLALKAAGGWRSNAYERYAHLAPRGLGPELLRHGWDFRRIGAPDREGDRPDSWAETEAETQNPARAGLALRRA